MDCPGFSALGPWGAGVPVSDLCGRLLGVTFGSNSHFTGAAQAGSRSPGPAARSEGPSERPHHRTRPGPPPGPVPPEMPLRDRRLRHGHQRFFHKQRAPLPRCQGTAAI